MITGSIVLASIKALYLLIKSITDATGTHSPGKRATKNLNKRSKNTSNKTSSQKSSFSAKSTARETTPLRQVNIADFAQFDTGQKLTGSKSVSPSTAADYQIHRVRTKSVNRRSVASVTDDGEDDEDCDEYDNNNDNDSNDDNPTQTDLHVAPLDAAAPADVEVDRIAKTPPIYQQIITEHPPPAPVLAHSPLLSLRRTESVSTISESGYLLPLAYPRQHDNFITTLSRGDSVDSRISYATTPESLPRIFGSPPPLRQASSDDSSDSYNTGEISIVVPRLPQLNITVQESADEGEHHHDARSAACDTELSQHIDDEPIVIITNEEGAHVKESDGRESGYSSMTPRLSVDSMAHTLSPMSCLTTGSIRLGIPGDHRSLTPNSTSSSYLDVPHSRPQSSTFDTINLIAPDMLGDSGSKKLFLEPKSPLQKLPAIESRCSNPEQEQKQTLNKPRLARPITIKNKKQRGIL